MSVDYRDLALAQYADDEAELIERFVDVTIERDSFRELAHAAIHALHDLRADHDRLRRHHHHLLDEYRRVRAGTMRQEVAA